MRSVKIKAAVCAGLTLGPAAMAGISVVNYGAGLAPTTIGPSALPLTAGLPDTSALSSPVTAAPLSGPTSLSFPSGALTHLAAPGTWGRGYSGAIYDSNGMTSVAIVPFGTNQIDALVLYVVPNVYGVFNVTVTGADSSSSVSSVAMCDGTPLNGGTARGWGFYGTGGSKITSVVITSDVPFNVGEFYYHNPSPSAAALFGLAAARRRRR